MTRDAEAAALKARCETAERLLERSRWEVEVLEGALRAPDDASRTGRAHRDRAELAARAAARHGAASTSALYVELEHYRRRLEDIHASTSWRITRPLRWLKRLLRGGDSADAAMPAFARALPPRPPATGPQIEDPAAAGTPVPGMVGEDAGPLAHAGRKVALLAAVSTHGAPGGAELLYSGLATALRRSGCAVEVIGIPVDESSFEAIHDAYRDFESLNLADFDCVISTKAPSFAVFHPNHIVYLVHTVRVFYDMFDAASPPERSRQRAWIQRADTEALGRARARFAIGREVADRLAASNGIEAAVLHPGLDTAGFRHAGYGDYFFLPGRLHPWKRVDLAIRAVLASRLPMRLVIAGDGESEAQLHALAAGDPRIAFLGRIDGETLRRHYAECLAVPFVPLREDYGYVTIEAFASAKAVVTCSDSGEPARIVRDGADGLVAEPTVAALRQALERLWLDRPLAARLGAAAGGRAADFAWDSVAGQLLAAAFDAPPAAAHATPVRVAVLDMQPMTPPLGGGRVRLLGLYRDLGAGFDVRFVGSVDWPDAAPRTTRLSPTLTETVVPLSPAHLAAAREAGAAAGGHVVIDALFGQQAHLSPDYRAAVEEAVAAADIVVFSHPWVAPLVAADRLAGKLVVYDAQNCEGRLKAQILDRGEPRQAAVVDYVAACEKALGERADLVIACSEADRTAFVADYGWDRSKIRIVPNGVFARDVHPPGAEERQAARLALGLPDDLLVAVFLGSDFAPNLEAAAFVAGPLSGAVPTTLFVLAGGCGDKVATANANCRLAGTLSEAEKRQWFAAADIALNPVASGSGTNIKMFDYMAHGLPVVSTPAGARGIVARTEAGIVVVDRDEFASGLSALAARSPGFRSGLGKANRDRAARDFDWHAISAGLGQLLREAVAERAPAAPARIAHLTTTGLRCGIGEYTRGLMAALAAEGASNLILTAASEDESPDLAALPQPAVIAWRREAVDWRYSEIRPVAFETMAAWGANRLIVQYHPGFYARGDVETLVRTAVAAGIDTRLVIHSLAAEDGPFLAHLATLGCVLFAHGPSELKLAAAAGIPLAHLPMPVHGLAAPAPRRPAPGAAPHIVANGFMRRHKGFRHLIAAMPAILRGYPDARLTLLAPPYPAPDSDDERAACIRLVEGLGLGGCVTIDATFHDPDALLARIADADLAVLPYEDSNEGGSAAAGDCLAAGTPLIVSRAAIFDGIRDVSVTAEADAAAIAHAVLEVLSEPATLDRLRQAGDAYRRDHTWRNAAQRLLR